MLICSFIINVGNRCAASYFFGTCDTIFQDSLINKKLKRTVFIQNRNFVLQYTLFKGVSKLFLSSFLKKEENKLILLFSKDVLNG